MSTKTLVNRIWLRWRLDPTATPRLGALLMWVAGIQRAK